MFLETERLILRNVRPEDAEDILPIRESEFVMKMNCMTSKTLDQMRAMLERNVRQDGYMHIELKETGRVIGMVGANQDDIRYMVRGVMIDYYLGEQYAHKGYMSEALRALIRYFFEEKNAELISARTFAENAASQGLLEKLGFVLEGQLRKGVRGPDGVVHEDRLYSILREEWAGGDGR